MTGTIAVLIPMLDEARDIANCIAHVAAQTVGVGRIQLVLVDGCSEDGTAGVAAGFAAGFGFHRIVLLENPDGRTSISLNVGLAAVESDYVVRVDARSRIQRTYVARCVSLLQERPDIGVVGGRQVALARSGTLQHRAVARSLRNRWTTGLGRYRRSTTSGSADTVWMGAFRTAELRALGGWSAATALNEDYELAERYRQRGSTVWFEATLRSGYLPRPDLVSLARQYFFFGRVKGLWWARGRRPTARQLLLMAVPPVALAGLVALGRLVGPVVAAVIVVAVAALVDHAGTGAPRRAGVAERWLAVVATALTTGGWWTGVLAGWIGERLGRTHRHA